MLKKILLFVLVSIIAVMVQAQSLEGKWKSEQLDFLGLALLVAYGWGACGLLLPTVFAAGLVLAARTEAARLNMLDTTRFVAAPPPVAVRVDSPARLCRAKRHDGWSADFLSHLGPLPIKVVVLLKDNDAPPAVGETWICSGRLS